MTSCPIGSTATAKPVHLSIFGSCVSFVSACTQEWCYDSKPSLWGADWTENEKEVTCEQCLGWIKEIEEVGREYGQIAR